MSKANEIKSNEFSLGDKLKIVRTRKGMSIKELSKATDVTVSYLARIENNVLINIGIKTFSKICHELDLADTDILEIIKSLDS